VSLTCNEPVSLLFEFHDEDESMTCNQRYLTKNIPARIFKCILETHVNEGRSYFEYREFKRNRTLFPTSKATNLEVRLRRLTTTLKKANLGLSLEMIGLGKLILKLSDGRLIRFVHKKKVG
jgi:hypothetical protein